MTIETLYRKLNEKIPSNLSCEWDNDGLMCADDVHTEVTKVLCALDITERTIDEAIEENCNVIVTHHPMLFKKIGAVDPTETTGKRIVSLLSHHIAVMSFHTRLDAVAGGVNDTLCTALQLKADNTFYVDGTEMGRLASVEPGEPFGTFCMRVKTALACNTVHCVSARKPVSRVAVLGGDGKDGWQAALAAGADTYVTGDMSYHAMLDAKAAGLNVIAVGHYFSEMPVMETVSAWIKEICPDTETVLSEAGCEVLSV